MRWFPGRPAGFDHLLCQPRRIGVCSDPRMHEFTSAVMNDKKHVQCLKPNGLNGEEITCPDFVAMLSQELSPTGGGCSTVWTAHVPGDSTRANSIAKTCQFRLDSALSPQRIIASHTANEIPEFGINLLASSSRRAARSPAPVGFPAPAMPTNHGIRFYND